MGLCARPLRTVYPRVLDYRIRLQYFSPAEAKIAILGPFGRKDGGRKQNPFVSQLTEGLAEQIVRDLIAASPGEGISPTQVQIVCSRLWREYAVQVPEIGQPEYDSLAGAKGILEGFLESELKGIIPSELRPIAVTILGNLITTLGTRDVVGTDKLRGLVGRYARDDEFAVTLKSLQERRLVNTTFQRGTFFHEVASEYLIPPIQKEIRQLTLERERHEAAEQAATEAVAREKELARQRELQQIRALAAEQERRAEAERLRAETERERADEKARSLQEQARRARTLRWLVFALGVMLLLAIGAVVFALRQRTVAVSNAQRAEQARASTEQEREIAERATNQIRQSLLIREAALAGNQARLDQLLGSVSQNTSIQFRANANSLRYRNPAGREVYEFTLYPEKGSLPSGKDSVAFITYLADHPSFRNTLMTTGPQRDFTGSYIGWGCLTHVVALIEFTDPEHPPTVSEFDMCGLLGWE